jgi:NAD(P)-dependent dehydrogenase (short-subunit alcohol dehydrogenase family)
MNLIEKIFSYPKINKFFIVALWAVVNNAGIAKAGFMEWIDTETVKKIFEVNAIGPFTVTNAFLPLLKISHGRVVIVSSVAGMHIQSSHFIFCIQIFTSITAQNF